MSDWQDYKIGEQSDTLELSRSEEHQTLALQMMQQARLSVLIFSRDLDYKVFDHQAFIDAASDMAREHPHSHIHILLQNSNEIITRGHRMVELAQRLSSKIKIHNPSKQYEHFNESFMVVDETAYIKRPLADRYEGQASFNDRSAARDMIQLFNEIWERSTPDPQLRRLHL